MVIIVSTKLLATIIVNDYTGDKGAEERDDCDNFDALDEV